MGDTVIKRGDVILVDYKNYRKLKNVKWLTKAFLQLAAYYLVTNSQSSSKLDGCLLATCSPRKLALYYMDTTICDIYVKLFLQCLEHYYTRAKFDWEGMLGYLGYEEMLVKDWSKIPERVYYAGELKELNEKKTRRKVKDELKEFTLF